MMPESAILPGLVIAIATLAVGVTLLIVRVHLSSSVQATRRGELIDPVMIAALVMFAGIAASAVGAGATAYFVLRLLKIISPVAG